MTELPPPVELVGAALRRDLDDLDMYAHFLESTLEGALPPALLQVERQTSLADRVRHRPGPVTRLAVNLGDRRYVLHQARGQPRAEIVHLVKGLELDHAEVPLDVWIRQLAQALTTHAAGNARAAAVLARLTDPTRTLDG